MRARRTVMAFVALCLTLANPAAHAFGGKVSHAGAGRTERRYLSPHVPPTVITWQTTSGQTPPAISIAANHSTGLKVESDGTLWCFGYNDFGQCGTGTAGVNYPNWQQSSINGAVWKVAGGYDFTYALEKDGTVWAAGWSDEGVLADGTDAPHQSNTFNQTVTSSGGVLSNIIAVAAGREHGLAIDNQGHLWVTGDNDTGQLGTGGPGGQNFIDPATYEANPPAYPGNPYMTSKWTMIDPALFNNQPVVEIACGADFSLARTADGHVWATGDNFDMELGYPTAGVVYQWIDTTPNGVFFKHIGAGWYHSLAIDANHRLWGAGRNDAGQLGNGTNVSQAWGVVDNRNTYQALGVSGLLHSYAIGTDGDLYATGDNSYYEFGTGTSPGASNTWMKVMAGPISQAYAAVDVSQIDQPNAYLGSRSFNGPATTVGLVNRQGQVWYAGETQANGVYYGTPAQYWTIQ